MSDTKKKTPQKDVDAGVSDKRLMLVETEFASVLKMIEREGNSLSPVLRNAWDGRDLQTLTKNSPIKASNVHVSLLGHITKTELLRSLSETEQANGLGNRFLWICIKRSKSLPRGGNLNTVDLSSIRNRIKRAVEFGKTVAEMGMDECAWKIWTDEYSKLTDDADGMFGAMTARAAPQVRRIACIYALLDCESRVSASHLRAALAVWRYAEDSCRYLFGDSVGDSTADTILGFLRRSPDGTTRTQLNDLFRRNLKKSQIDQALTALLNANLARSEMGPADGGRPPEIWFAQETNERDEKCE